jgi:tRNA A37 threonylcarbamoyladenosine biosynthesis protein TsaE
VSYLQRKYLNGHDCYHLDPYRFTTQCEFKKKPEQQLQQSKPGMEIISSWRHELDKTISKQEFTVPLIIYRITQQEFLIKSLCQGRVLILNYNYVASMLT